MIPWLACAAPAPVGETSTIPTSTTEPSAASTPTDPFTPFTPALTLVVDGAVVPPGGTLVLDPVSYGLASSARPFWLVNPTEDTVVLAGDPGSWLVGDPAIHWEQTPPATLAPGQAALVSLALDPVVVGPAAATLILPTDRGEVVFGVAGEVGPPRRLVVIGRLGRVLLSDDYGLTFFSDTQVGVSPDEDEWSTDPKTEDLAWGNGVFVAVGGVTDALLRWSVDGEAWTEAEAPSAMSAIDAVAFGGDRFVVVDGGGLAWSTDGGTWLSGDNVGWRPGLAALAYGNGVFVGVGSTRRIVTVNGGSFLSDEDNGLALYDVAFGAGVFVGVGPGGLVATSTDGITWTEQWIGTASRYDVAYGPTGFVSGGWPGLQIVSTDGWNFAEHAGDRQSGALAAAAGAYFAESWPNSLWRSSDGLSWTQVVAARQDRAGLTAAALAGP